MATNSPKHEDLDSKRPDGSAAAAAPQCSDESEAEAEAEARQHETPIKALRRLSTRREEELEELEDILRSPQARATIPRRT